MLKIAREKRHVIYKGTNTVIFSSKPMQARRQENDIFKVLEDKNCQPVFYSQ